jgi:hypothetical protein
MPWEFLQGVAEQKQKGYDSAVAAGDTASKLLNFEVIPGDVQGKNELQKKYNDRILGIQDYLSQTGDFNMASRQLTSVVRDIAQDPFINNMKAAVPIWKEQQKEKDKLESEGEILDFNNKWDYMYSTINPETGMTRSYQQSLPYKGRTIGKAVYDDYKDAIDGKVIQTYGDRVGKNENGEWVYKKTGKRLGQDLIPIMQTAGYEISGRYPTYFRDRTNYEIKAGISKEGENPKWLQSLMGGLASEYHVSNVETDFKPDWQYEYLWKKQQDKETPAIPVQDVGIKTKGKVFDISNTTSTKDVAIPGQTYATSKQTTYETPYKLKQQGKLPDNEWHMMGNYLMKSNPSLYNKVFGEGLGSKASQEDLKQAYEQFKNYHDILYAEAGSNAKVRAVTNPTNLHAMFGGVKSADLTLSNLEGSPGIGSQGYLYDLTNNKFLTVEELKNQVGNKI